MDGTKMSFVTDVMVDDVVYLKTDPSQSAWFVKSYVYRPGNEIKHVIRNPHAELHVYRAEITLQKTL